jgi:hypothetical protein
MINNIKAKETNEEMKKKAISLLHNKLERQEDNLSKEEEKIYKKRNIEDIIEPNLVESNELNLQNPLHNILDKQEEHTDIMPIDGLANFEKKENDMTVEDINQNNVIHQDNLPQEEGSILVSNPAIKSDEERDVSYSSTIKIEKETINLSDEHVSSFTAQKTPLPESNRMELDQVQENKASELAETNNLSEKIKNPDVLNQEINSSEKHKLIQDTHVNSVINSLVEKATNTYEKKVIRPQFTEPLPPTSQIKEDVTSVIKSLVEKETNSDEKKVITAPSTEPLPPPSQIKEEAPQPKKITFMSAKKEVDEFTSFLDKVEKDIENKYGINLSVFNYEDILPDELKLKLVEEFFNSKEILDLVKNIK